MDKKVAAFGYFTLSVPIEYTHPFSEKICRVLDIMITVDYVLIKQPNSNTRITMGEGHSKKVPHIFCDAVNAL